MRIRVTGNTNNPILFDSNDAEAMPSALYIEIEGAPCTIYRFFSNGNGFVRSQKGEDKDFDLLAKQLGLI